MERAAKHVIGLTVVAGVLAVAAGAGAADAALKKRGEVSVAAAAFTDDSGNDACRVAKAAYAIYPTSDAGGADCDLVAGIQLPDGADLTSMTCTVYDNQPANGVQVHLVRVSLASGDPESVLMTTGTADGGLQQVGDATPEAGASVVDNAKYAYYVAAAFSTSEFGSELRLYGCTVSHE